MKKQKRRILISCGPTREPLDPVRFISNYSTGVLGVEIARRCMKAGHDVTLVHGPIEIPKAIRAKKVHFETALELKRILARLIHTCDALVMNAAIADFKPLTVEPMKIKKGRRILKLTLVENPDILKFLQRFKKKKQIFMGFSVESRNIYPHAWRKLREKGLDFIVAHHATGRIRPFGKVGLNAAVLEDQGQRHLYKNISKASLAKVILNNIERRLALADVH